MANRCAQIRRIPRIGFATLLVVLLISALLSFCHVWWDIDFSHPSHGDPFWTWDSMVMGFLLGMGVIALGTPVVDEKYRNWFVLRDFVRWPERLRWRVVRQEWFAIVLSVVDQDRRI